MLLRLTNIFLTAVIALACIQVAVGQKTDTKEQAKPAVSPTPKGPAKPLTAEQVVETSIYIYGGIGGRTTLDQIRKTSIERGRTTLTGADGKIDQATYQRFTIRGGPLAKDRIRLDQDFPTAKYSLVFAADKVFGVYNNTVFTPREDASKSFENIIFHGLEALLRYKESESTLELAGREKILGVEYYLIDVTDKQARKTRFYISVKLYRVMIITYEDGGVKYRRRFYDYNYAQGTLVPHRSVLWANDKMIEESEVGTITFGQKVDEDLFRSN